MRAICKLARWAWTKATLRTVVASLVLTGATMPPAIGAAASGGRVRDSQASPAAADWIVRAGAAHPTDPRVPYNYTRFYPSTLRVHRGQTVEWRFTAGTNGWMTVTFYPGDMDVQKHPAPLLGVLDPRFRKAPPPHVAFNEPWLLGNEGGTKGVASGAPCGRGMWQGTVAAQPTCVLRSTAQYVSSSLYDRFLDTHDPGTFRVTIDLPPGTYRYHCKYHPAMVGTIEVDQDSVALPTQEQIDRQVSEQIAQDTRAADAVVRHDSDPANAYDRVERRWTVHVGDSTPDKSVSINQYLPEDLSVHAGDAVTWVAGGQDLHTVTFPAQLRGGWSLGGTCNPSSCRSSLGHLGNLGNPLSVSDYLFECQIPLPGVGPISLPLWNPATYTCPEGSRVELLMGPGAAQEQHAPGDRLMTPTTYHNSGFINPSDFPSWLRDRGDGSYFPSTFGGTFPTVGEFHYFCKAHPDFMTGTVRVASSSPSSMTTARRASTSVGRVGGLE